MWNESDILIELIQMATFDHAIWRPRPYKFDLLFSILHGSDYHSLYYILYTTWYTTILTYNAENLYLFTLYNVNYKILLLMYLAIKFNFSKIKLINLIN